MKESVGIEALAVALPRRFLSLRDLAEVRGVDPAKYLSGLGGQEMMVADPGEDAAALAATAASRLFAQQRIDPDRIGMLVVGTETGVDHSKAVASHVHGLLGLHRSMRVFDAQQACYGATAGLMAAVEWIASGAAAGRSALVIASDIARYERLGAGEPTQGAAAVALLVSSTPHLLALDLGLNGACSMDVYDFWRPHGRKEALVDGHYSIQCYLDVLAEAYRGWRGRAVAAERVGWGPSLPSEQLARIAYHVPFCKMARKAHAQVRRVDLEDRPGGRLPEAEIDALARSDDSHGDQVAPSLWLNARVGNAYTASLYLALAGLLHRDAAPLAGRRIGLFSYGSGCSSEFFSGTVGSEAAARIAAADLEGLLASRQRIGPGEYEEVLALTSPDPAAAPPPGGFRLAEIRDHRRLYLRG
ncbi:MAG: hydroxymethylglutaryl-CoA synthase [Polyangiaceae bacterium]|jgi:hydroxymethylglutaryl-CoA synthase|nr:hydroxymethylglutaryl-CoA synthase [Polyangiaceae bacterium]